jgi:acetyl esterase/lipase
MPAYETRFDAFNQYKTAYKTINGHPIDVNILIPKSSKPKSRHPVFVKWHGGGLVLGEAMHAPWFAHWLISMALRNNAIIIAPNYRLIPEHNGKDIMSDLRDFWKWYDEQLERFVESSEPGVELDKGKLLVGGDSAGGLVALQSALVTDIGREGRIKALLCQYPMTDKLERPFEDTFKDIPSPKSSYIDEHIASIKPNTVLSSAVPPIEDLPTSRIQLSYALAAHGRWLEFYGTDKELLPITAIEGASSFPPALIVHGKQDTLVSIDDSRRFVKRVGDVLGKDIRGHLRLVEGEGDHGFDMEFAEEDTPWLRDEVKWLEGKWLS